MQSDRDQWEQSRDTYSFEFRYPKSKAGINIQGLRQTEEPTVILGVNGAGKSTFLRAIAGDLRGVTGNAPAHAGSVYVSQNFIPVKGFSVLDYVNYIAWLQGASRKSSTNNAQKWAEFVGLGGDLLSQECTKLSGGQQSKLQLATALNSDAELLLLDEPSAALDPLAKTDLQDLYRDVVDEGIRLWVSSHQPPGSCRAIHPGHRH